MEIHLLTYARRKALISLFRDIRMSSNSIHLSEMSQSCKNVHLYEVVCSTVLALCFLPPCKMLSGAVGGSGNPQDTSGDVSRPVPHQKPSFGGDMNPEFGFLDLYFVTK